MQESSAALPRAAAFREKLGKVGSLAVPGRAVCGVGIDAGWAEQPRSCGAGMMLGGQGSPSSVGLELKLDGQSSPSSVRGAGGSKAQLSGAVPCASPGLPCRSVLSRIRLRRVQG